MTGAITVAVVGARDVAKDLGKKGTSSDVTLYNAVRDGHAATIVEPTQFPEKLAPLLTALAMADRTVAVVNELTREVAESLAAVDLLETPVDLLTGPGVGEAELGRALKGTRLESLPVRPLDLPHLRAEVDAWEAPPAPGSVLVPIDHAFPVKGVGAVALGVVRRGTLTAHDRLRLYPSDRLVEVRSIQVHDADVRSAATGERVGVALRGVEAEELERGQCLAPEGALTVGARLSGRIEKPCPYYRGRAVPGLSAHLQVGLQLVPVRITGADGPTLALEADRAVAAVPGASALLADLSPKAGPRLVARLRLGPGAGP